MGIYLNPGNVNFKEIVSADIYVDKTMMIDVTNRFIDKGKKYVCFSRPRRFGKTFAGNMLCAYYSKGCDSSELFADFKIAKTAGFAAKLNRYNVIKIDMNSLATLHTILWKDPVVFPTRKRIRSGSMPLKRKMNML